MFNNLTDFGYKRNLIEAIGFYLAYFIIIVILSALAESLIGIINPKTNLILARAIGVGVATILCLVLSFLILINKKLIGNLGFVLLALLSGVLALILGALGGLIVTAYLTTIPPRDKI